MKKTFHLFIFLLLCSCSAPRDSIFSPSISATATLNPKPEMTRTPDATTSFTGVATQTPHRTTPTLPPELEATPTTIKRSGVFPWCWDGLSQHVNPKYLQEHKGLGLRMQESPDHILWVLYERVLIKINEKEGIYFLLEDFVDCDSCELTGTMATAPSGEVWLGYSDGLLLLKDNTWKHIPYRQIFPEAIDKVTGMYALTVTSGGVVWVSDRYGNVCSYNRKWRCQPLTLQESNEEILSAAVVGEDHLWFGTNHGKVIDYKAGKKRVVDLLELFADNEPWGEQVKELLLDPKSGELWVLFDNAVMQRNLDEEWRIFDTSYFLCGDDPPGWYFGCLKAITIDDQGKLWLGMRERYGLLFFDEENWMTLMGHAIPLPVQPKLRADFIRENCLLPYDWIVDVVVSERYGILVLDFYGSIQVYIGSTEFSEAPN